MAPDMDRHDVPRREVSVGASSIVIMRPSTLHRSSVDGDRHRNAAITAAATFTVGSVHVQVTACEPAATAAR